MKRSSKWRRQVDDALIPSYETISMQQRNADHLFFFLSYLDAPLLLGNKTCNPFVPFCRIDICENKEDRGIRCICLQFRSTFPWKRHTTHIFDPFSLYPSAVFSALDCNAYNIRWWYPQELQKRLTQRQAQINRKSQASLLPIEGDTCLSAVESPT